jgi:hypothetical protein
LTLSPFQRNFHHYLKLVKLTLKYNAHDTFGSEESGVTFLQFRSFAAELFCEQSETLEVVTDMVLKKSFITVHMRSMNEGEYRCWHWFRELEVQLGEILVAVENKREKVTKKKDRF